MLAELRYAVLREMAYTLSDLLIRRVPVAFETTDHGRAAARAVAGAVGSWLGWDDDSQRRAVADYDANAARIFTIDP